MHETRSSNGDVPGSRFRSVLSATRLHLRAEVTELPEATCDHLRGYLEQAERLGVTVAIAVNSNEATIRRIAKETTPDLHVHVLYVPCWGAFVPALNTLLGFAQRMGLAHILYQSLEVRCGPAVLQRLLDFMTRDMLVVGPELPGHDFSSGERALNGRTVPWNTLALWSVRKLALTGFLCIADGLSATVLTEGNTGVGGGGVAASVGDDETDDEIDNPTATPWWDFEGKGLIRQMTEAVSVPAGVEEVTAVALLQHLHGSDASRAVLLRLPKSLESDASWTASWGGDEGRAKWHSYKMASKVARPAAQLQQLFKPKKSKSLSQLSDMMKSFGDSLGGGLRRRASSKDLASNDKGPEASSGKSRFSKGLPADSAQLDSADESTASPLQFGTVLHYDESIPPLPRLKWICLAAFLLFSMNSTVVLASAFHHINSATPATTSETGLLVFVGLLIGSIYFPMPLSLWLTRFVVRRWSHRCGMLVVGFCTLVAHFSVVVSQLSDSEQLSVLLLSRIVQGLGSGVLFLARFVLASVSTSDQHVNLQSWSFLANDLGLGLGALLPAVASIMPGCAGLARRMPDLLPSLLLAVLSLAYIIGVAMAFPVRLPALSNSVRFANQSTKERSDAQQTGDTSADVYRYIVWISGTARVFVQSAILPTVALSMRDAGWTGHFRQTYAVAAICLLPMPFEALVTRIRCTCLSGRGGEARDGTHASKVASGAVGAVALLLASAGPGAGRRVIGGGEDALEQAAGVWPLLMRISELGVLMVALAMAAPFNASRLYQLRDAEYATVMLEWMKAYVGRLLGPLFAVLTYSLVGYGALLGALCAATAVVTLTA